jgi:hypothetical protein
MGMLVMRRLLHLMISAAFLMTAFSSVVSAATQAGPTLGFQLFERKHPADLGIVRLSGGFFVLKELNPVLAIHTGFLYTTENSVFQDESKFDEKGYHLRLGLFTRLYEVSVFRFGMIAGAQYGLVRQRYETVAPGATYFYRMFQWSPYFALEGQALPVAGFGLKEGISFCHDPIAKSWITEFYFGATL